MIQRRLSPALLVLLAVFTVGSSVAAPSTSPVQRGDSAYARQKFDSAAYFYQEAVAGYSPDPVVLYKLGNAHYRLGQTGEAVLAYERALQLRPGFAEAAENVRIIQRNIQPAAVENDVFFMRWWYTLTSPTRSNSWAVLAIICFCIPISVLIWSRYQRRWPTWLWPHIIVGGIVLSFLFAVLSAVAVSRAARDTGVVMRQGSGFSTGGKSGSNALLVTLPEGLVVKVLRDDGSSLRVLLPDGREGLVQRSDIAIVK